MKQIDWDLKPPKRWEDFEALCTELFAAEYSLTDISRYGKGGSSQDGVDIFGFGSKRRLRYGIQCKKKQQWPVASLRSKEDLCEQIDMARQFSPPLDYYFIVTTASKRKAYDDALNNHLHQHPDIPFQVKLFCWEDINTLLNEHKAIVRKYYPEVFEARSSTLADEMEIMNKKEVFYVYRAGQTGRFDYHLRSKNYDHTYISVSPGRLVLNVMWDETKWSRWLGYEIGYMHIDIYGITNQADDIFIKRGTNCYHIFMGMNTRSWDIQYETGGQLDPASWCDIGHFKGAQAYSDTGRSLDPEASASISALWDTLQALYEQILNEEGIVD